MAALTVWKFNTPAGAEQVLSKLESLSKQQLITIEDAAVVSWQPGKKKPKTRQLHSMTGAGALGGAFWGMLFGLLFFADRVVQDIVGCPEFHSASFRLVPAVAGGPLAFFRVNRGPSFPPAVKTRR